MRLGPLGPLHNSIVEEGLQHGHEYEWSYKGKSYSLCPVIPAKTILFFAEGVDSKAYPSVDAIIAAGFDLVKMMNENPDLYECWLTRLACIGLFPKKLCTKPNLTHRGLWPIKKRKNSC